MKDERERRWEKSRVVLSTEDSYAQTDIIDLCTDSTWKLSEGQGHKSISS